MNPYQKFAAFGSYSLWVLGSGIVFWVSGVIVTNIIFNSHSLWFLAFIPAINLLFLIYFVIKRVIGWYRYMAYEFPYSERYAKWRIHDKAR